MNAASKQASKPGSSYTSLFLYYLIHESPKDSAKNLTLLNFYFCLFIFFIYVESQEQFW